MNWGGYFLVGFLVVGCQTVGAQRVPQAQLGRPNSEPQVALDCNSDRKTMLNIAHRGNESEFLENTQSSFLSAAQLGADLVELDVQFTKDDIPIVFHDTDLKRQVLKCLLHQNKNIRDLTYNELSTDCSYNSSTSLNTGFYTTFLEPNLKFYNHSLENSQKIPLLEDVIRVMSQTQTGILIELKTSFQQGAVLVPTELNYKILDLLKNLDPNGSCAKDTADYQTRVRTFNCFEKIKIMSFDGTLMDAISREAKTNTLYRDLKNVRMLKLIYPNLESVRELVDERYKDQYWNLDGVAFSHLVSEGYKAGELEGLVRKMNCDNDFSKEKLKFIWTVASPQDLKKLSALSVDGLINGVPRYFSKNGYQTNPERYIQNSNSTLFSTLLQGYSLSQGQQFSFGKGKNVLEDLNTNFEISVSVQALNQQKFGIIFNQDDGPHYYSFEWEPQIKRIAILKTTPSGTRTLIQDTKTYNGEWVTLNVKRLGPMLVASVNDMPVFSVSIKAIDANPYGLQYGGWVGFLTQPDTQYKNVSYKEIATP